MAAPQGVASQAPACPEKSTLQPADPPVEQFVNPSGRTSDDEKASDPVDADDAHAEVPPRNVSGVKWGIVVTAIMSSTFLFALDNTVVADVQPIIVTQFNSVAEIAWLSVAFIMTAVSLNLLYGQLYSHLPAKWLYLGATILFEVGSAVCGAAPNMAALIVGRALAGVGGIGMYLGVLSLLHHTTTLQERPIYVALTGLTWAVGTILGPVVGGAFADSDATWRWSFYINLVIFGLAAPVYFFLLPLADPYHSKASTPTLRTRLSHIDWLGAFLMLAMLLCFVVAINFGGIEFDWNSGAEIALFVVAGVLLIAFTLQQKFSLLVAREDRIFPSHLIRPSAPSARTLLLMFCCTAAGGAAIFLPVYFIPLFFQFTRGDSAKQAAVSLLPFILVMVFVTLLMGGILSTPGLGLYMPWFLIGGIIATVGGALMFTVTAETSAQRVYGYSALTGMGVGCFAQAGFSIAQASVPVSEGHVASAFIALAQVGGITLALAIANSIFVNRAEDALRAILPGVPREEIQRLLAGVSDREKLAALGPETQKRILDALVDAISRPYILVIVAGALVTVLSLGMKRERLFLKPPVAGA